jgi:hypothetical protein
MARKLIGIEPRPSRPRQSKTTDASASNPQRAAVAIEAMPTGNEELIKLWHPQASMLARRGRAEFVIAKFLRSKGVEADAARSAAQTIVAHSKTNHGSWVACKRVIGWLLLGTGLLVPIGSFMLAMSGVVMMICAMVAVLAGCKLLWPATEPD